jgi:hypothetical protein
MARRQSVTLELFRVRNRPQFDGRHYTLPPENTLPPEIVSCIFVAALASPLDASRDEVRRLSLIE